MSDENGTPIDKLFENTITQIGNVIILLGNARSDRQLDKEESLLYTQSCRTLTMFINLVEKQIELISRAVEDNIVDRDKID